MDNLQNQNNSCAAECDNCQCKKGKGRVLMIGAGGVATVCAFKIAQNADVFGDFMIASRQRL